MNCSHEQCLRDECATCCYCQAVLHAPEDQPWSDVSDLEKKCAALEEQLERVTILHFEESVALGIANRGWAFEELKVKNLETENENLSAGVHSLECLVAVLDKENAELKNIMKYHKLHHEAPCCLCGYNGPNYFQPDTHGCMKR